MAHFQQSRSVRYNSWDVTDKVKNSHPSKNIQLTAALGLETATDDGLENDTECILDMDKNDLYSQTVHLQSGLTE